MEYLIVNLKKKLDVPVNDERQVRHVNEFKYFNVTTDQYRTLKMNLAKSTESEENYAYFKFSVGDKGKMKTKKDKNGTGYGKNCFVYASKIWMMRGIRGKWWRCNNLQRRSKVLRQDRTVKEDMRNMLSEVGIATKTTEKKGFEVVCPFTQDGLYTVEQMFFYDIQPGKNRRNNL